MASQVNSTKHFQTIKKKIANEGTLLNSLYKATIALILKLDKVITKGENYRPISLKKIDEKSSKKKKKTKKKQLLANQIQQYSKRIIHHNQVGFIPGCKDFSLSTKVENCTN